MTPDSAVDQNASSPSLDEPLYEVINGLRVDLPPMGAYPTEIVSKLDQTLGPYATQKGLGKVVCEMLFLIDRKTGLQRRPDLAFISAARWPVRRPAPETAAWDVVPDLAIEVVSPTDEVQELIGKVVEFFRCGVRQVWVVHPKHRFVYVYDSLAQIRVLTRSDVLEGGTIVAGFRLPLAQLFPDESAERENGAENRA